jgi:cytoskeletal protein CcmA (bactofilin family)
MSDVTVIGRGANIVGTVSGAVDLTVHGRIEGAVSVEGDVTIEAEGLVAAGVSGRRVVVRGAVKGDVTAEDAIRLEEGARVVGDLRAPRVAITRGALIRGHVATGGGAEARPARAQAGAERPGRQPHAAPARVSPPARPVAAPPEPVAAPPRRAAPPSLLAGGSTSPRPEKGPPPPVVPALRKGTKGTMKKRAG